MDAFAALFKSKTWWSMILALLWEVLNTKFNLGAPSGAGLAAPLAMGMRTWGKEAK